MLYIAVMQTGNMGGRAQVKGEYYIRSFFVDDYGKYIVGSRYSITPNVVCQACHYREEAFMKETNSSPQPL